MTKQDQIAVALKGQPLFKNASMVVLGYGFVALLRANPEPCDPPDYVPSSGDDPYDRFCGLPVLKDTETKEGLWLVVQIPTIILTDQ